MFTAESLPGGGSISVSADVVPGLPTQRKVDRGSLIVGENLFEAYLEAERRAPNSLIPIGPFVINEFLRTLSPGSDMIAAVRGLVTASFSPSQRKRGINEANRLHGENEVQVTGVPVITEKNAQIAERQGKTLFVSNRLDTIYRQGVGNALDAILTLDFDTDSSQLPSLSDKANAVAAFLGREPRNLTSTQEIFRTVVEILEREDARALTDAYTKKIARVKDRVALRRELQGDLITLMTGPTGPVVAIAGENSISEAQVNRFLHVLTNPELSEEAA